MATVHPTAIVAAEAQLAASVDVGPYVVIEGDVAIGANTSIGPFCRLSGPCMIGSDNRFYGHSSIGGESQDKKGQDGALVIGDRNYVREFVTINRATAADKRTVIGSDNWIMAYCHVAHECRLGDRVVMGNLSQIAGHVELADGVIMGGGALVHQNLRIGELAILGGATGARQDVPPYANFTVTPGRVSVSVNKVGLSRAGLDAHSKTIAAAFKILYHEGNTLAKARERITELAVEHAILAPLAQFLDTLGPYGIVRPHQFGLAGEE